MYVVYNKTTGQEIDSFEYREDMEDAIDRLTRESVAQDRFGYRWEDR